MESPNNEIQIVDQMTINRAYDNAMIESQTSQIIPSKIPLTQKPKSSNEIQNIDQMVILPIPRKNLIIQNIDRLDIPRDYDKYQYIMQSSLEERKKGVQALGRPIHAEGKETGLECQDIDNFEILGSIISQQNYDLELEYINSIEIIERNNNRNWNDLEIEFVEEFKLDPNNNEVGRNRNNISISYNGNNNNNNGNNGGQGGHGGSFGNSNNNNSNNQNIHGSYGYRGNQGNQENQRGQGYRGNQGNQTDHGNYGFGNQGKRGNQDGNDTDEDDQNKKYGHQSNKAGKINLGKVNYINMENTSEEMNTNNNNYISQIQSEFIGRNINNRSNINTDIDNNIANLNLNSERRYAEKKMFNDKIIRTGEIQNVDQFEIIGIPSDKNIEIERILENERKRILEEERQGILEEERQKIIEEERQKIIEEERQRILEEERQRILEEERQRIANLTIQRISELKVIDNANSNINLNINNNINNNSNNRAMGNNMNINLISNNNFDDNNSIGNNNNNINSINNDILNNMQNKKNQIRISSMQNEINYDESKSNKNVNLSSFEPEKEKYIRNKYAIGEVEKEKQKHSWNKVNNIQQTSKLVIYSKRNSYSYFRESGNRSSWNEKNRQQGIVNLSVIDDNKKNLDKNREIELNKENDNIGINFNDRNLQSSTRPIRNINNDYDVDGFEISQNLNKFDKKIENKEEMEEEPKEEKISIGSKRSKKSKYSGDMNEKKLPSNKSSPKGQQQLTYQYNTNQSQYSSKNSNKNIIINNNNKLPSATNKIYIKDSLQGNKPKININTNIDDKLKPSSSLIYNNDNKTQAKKNLVININNNKKSQMKPSGLTYMIDNTGNKKDEINLNKEKKSYQPINSNFPKLRTYERDSNPRFVSQSQNIATGKMKKKTKEKRFEYVREPNQSQNFQ